MVVATELHLWKHVMPEFWFYLNNFEWR
jgi:hypothetical protein